MNPQVTKTISLKKCLDKRSRAVAFQAWSLLFLEDVVTVIIKEP